MPGVKKSTIFNLILTLSSGLSCFTVHLQLYTRSKQWLFIPMEQAGPFVHLKSSFTVLLKADKGRKVNMRAW
jgi:hypothetical protein